MRTIEIVAKNLKFYRQQRGLTQEELASKAYTSASYISRIERMVANPSIESLDSIAMALGLSPAELFRIDEVDILPSSTMNSATCGGSAAPWSRGGSPFFCVWYLRRSMR